MKEYKWSVGLRHKATRARLCVCVWAPTNDAATHALCGSLIGPECEYDWTGTGPVYENNRTVCRDSDPADHEMPVRSAFARYREAMEGVGVLAREAILARAAQDPDLPFEDFIRLCKASDPEAAWA